MRRLTLALTLMLSVVTAGCVSFPKQDIEIATEADPKVNFSAYKTYTWIGSAQILRDPAGTWEPLGFNADALITSQIEGELGKRGMTQTETYPDMLIAYALGVDMAAIKVKDDPESKVRVLKNVPEGALVVVMLDTDTGLVTWAAVATAELQNMGDEIARQRIEYTISEMFQEFPK